MRLEAGGSRLKAVAGDPATREGPKQGPRLVGVAPCAQSVAVGARVHPSPSVSIGAPSFPNFEE